MSDTMQNGRGLTLPSIASMTQGLPQDPRGNGQPPFDTRDSGNWSLQSQSKHSSTLSNPNHLQTILNADDTAHRLSGPPTTPSSLRFPVPPQQNGVVLPALSQAFDHRASTASIDPNTSFYVDSRRSSIDSRVNSNMGHLALNHATPYESNNVSTTSLASNLQHQRGIPRTSATNPLSPTSRRGSGAPAGPRRAPAIQPNIRSGGMPNPLSSTPTKGFAWAFPDNADPNEMDEGSSPDSSRQGSLAATSIYTIDSTAPGGQGRYTDDGFDTHRGSVQHQRIADLQAGDAGSIGTGNYSRTPELRVSHKLAERKRRSEMKDLFDTLNKCLPNSPGNKSSKWEILSKAIEYVNALKSAYDNLDQQNRKFLSDQDHARQAIEDNKLLHNEIVAMYQQLLRVDPHGHHVFGPKTQQLVSQEGQTPGRLAPLQPHQASQANWLGPSNSSMQGVEYGNPYERR